MNEEENEARIQELEAIIHFRKAMEFALPGYDWANSQHLGNTPERFIRTLKELATPLDFNFTVFDNVEKVDEMVIVGPVDFTSLCAHHLLPFTGHAWVGYLPSGKLAGLSKLARAVKAHSRGLWVQEDLNQFIANYLESKLMPMGVGVVMKAEHTCMTIRGVMSTGSMTTTSAMKGVFLDPERGARQEFLDLIKDM